ncbi:MAG: methylated-DNA--[protein]-cysteine S-methyltransferase [Actinobacteria bacterium]|nr:methylated-DNA--[protein]-cysteine S-methyltransferase [Actinomycetota bacterium]
MPPLGDTSELSRTTVTSPVGELTLIASPRGLRAVLWPNEFVSLREDDAEQIPLAADGDPGSAAVLEQARRELQEYFAGDRREFDVPLDPVGTDFQLSAWLELRRIPFGSTISYGEQARRLGDVNKSRAVGAANGRNPISIIVPCHRVVGSNGQLVGFAAGLDAKAWLLRHEQGKLSLPNMG